jgi:hypothetical protein
MTPQFQPGQHNSNEIASGKKSFRIQASKILGRSQPTYLKITIKIIFNTFSRLI